MSKNNRKETMKFSKGVGNIKETNEVIRFYQVVTGDMGVVLPKELNLETMSGLTLVKGQASCISNIGIASKIKEATGGKLVQVVESFSRKCEEVPGERSENESESTDFYDIFNQ
ncbi:hypothetical protein [Bacillus sp. Marseille-P3800]|uniref:hypothetical protein n=1 Tax=Bacillus sp. Marseille-P3800 TaxID=2014782 RepID=UPI00114583ED|nr:hypothetical protein [Bacillus sp. Marseille-P3800]